MLKTANVVLLNFDLKSVILYKCAKKELKSDEVDTFANFNKIAKNFRKLQICNNFSHFIQRIKLFFFLENIKNDISLKFKNIFFINYKIQHVKK